MNRVVRTDQEVGADGRQLLRRRQHQLANAHPVASIDALHVRGEGVRVHRDLGMVVRPEELSTLSADSAITQRRAFGGTRHDADVIAARSLPSGIRPQRDRVREHTPRCTQEGDQPGDGSILSRRPRHSVLLTHLRGKQADRDRPVDPGRRSDQPSTGGREHCSRQLAVPASRRRLHLTNTCAPGNGAGRSRSVARPSSRAARASAIGNASAQYSSRSASVSGATSFS